MCLKCNDQPHFPAECSQTSIYRKELEENGDTINVDDRKVEDNYVSFGKRCPKCKTYMEKDFGCNHMHCTMCNSDFCWNCLRLTSEHDNEYACVDNSKTKHLVEIEFKNKRKNKPRKVIYKENRYESSIDHRNKQSKKAQSDLKK